MGAEYSGIMDMINGGGAGQSGDKFEGGLMSGLANNVMQDRGYANPLDMIDGGGAGQSGDKFEGGGLMSLIANMAGSPHQAPPPPPPRMSSQSGPVPQQRPNPPPGMNPEVLLPYQAGYQPPVNSDYSGAAIDVQPLMAGGMTMDEIRAAIARDRQYGPQ